MTQTQSMTADRNPQKRCMADESMVRTLAAQAEAIWPQEREWIRAYGLSAQMDALDVGSGTGEFSSRLAEMFPAARVRGVEVLPERVACARDRHAALAPRLAFLEGDAFALAFPDAHFDFVACRHVLQSVPEPEQVIEELIRVTRPGGRLHLLVEDYAMIHTSPTRHDLDEFWQRCIRGFAAGTGVDLRIGRRSWQALARRGLRELAVHYLVIDTLRVPRDLLARIFEAWRDGYTDPVAEWTGMSREESREYFDDLIACIRNPEGYAVWQIPVVSGVKP